MKLSKNEFIKISKSLNNRFLENSNKKIVGYYCSYIPEEIFYAADLIPFRMRSIGEKSTDLADVYMVRFTCSYIRATFNLALKGYYNYLDGFFVCNGCDHSRRMYELFDLKIFENKNVPLFYMSVPHVISNESFNWFDQEIRELKSKIEKKYNVKISNEKLIKSTKVYNENRRLMSEINNKRKKNPSYISGTQFLQISLSNTSVPKDYANTELKNIINSLDDSSPLDNNKKRILIAGSALDSPDFVQLIEETGAIVVSDFMCFGGRYVENQISLDPKDPINGISKRLYYKTSCPRIMNDHENRLRLLLEEIKRSQASGVILQRINNCDLHGCDNMLFEHELKELNIPVLTLDREVFLEDKIRLRTRIEAFLEII